MKNEDEKTHSLITKAMSGRRLSKKEDLNSESILKRIDLDSLRMNNPKLKELEKMPEDQFLKHLGEHFRDKEILQEMVSQEMVKFYEWIKNGKEGGTEKARKSLILSEKLDFVEKYKGKRFKAPPNFEAFVKDIKILQREYPDILRRSHARKELKKQTTKEWDRKAQKIEPIYTTRELAESLGVLRAFWGSRKSKKKTLSSIRTKVKRAKDAGFL